MGQKQGDRKTSGPKAKRQEEIWAKSKETGRMAGQKQETGRIVGQKQGDRKNGRPKAREKKGSRGGFMHHTGVEILPRSATRRGLR